MVLSLSPFWVKSLYPYSYPYYIVLSLSPFWVEMERKDLKKLTKGQLIKLLLKNVSNHEDLLDNDHLRMKLHKSLQNVLNQLHHRELENGKV